MLAAAELCKAGGRLFISFGHHCMACEAVVWYMTSFKVVPTIRDVLHYGQLAAKHQVPTVVVLNDMHLTACNWLTSTTETVMTGSTTMLRAMMQSEHAAFQTVCATTITPAALISSVTSQRVWPHRHLEQHGSTKVQRQYKGMHLLG